MSNLLKGIGNFLIGVGVCAAALAYMGKPNANFEIVQLGSVRADQFLLDKSSGRIWQKTCYGTVNNISCNGQTIWHELFVYDITPEGSAAVSELRDFIAEQEKESAKHQNREK